MGLDIYIEARICEKNTGRVISSSDCSEYDVCDEDKGFFEICSWNSRIFSDIRTKMIEISNKYAGTDYTDADFVIPIPQSALREIYAYIVNRSCLSDDECFEVSPCDIEWEVRAGYEKTNLINAGRLHDLLYMLNIIKSDTNVSVSDTVEKYISDKNDLKHLEENPKEYRWEFRIFNSY